MVESGVSFGQYPDPVFSLDSGNFHPAKTSKIEKPNINKNMSTDLSEKTQKYFYIISEIASGFQKCGSATMLLTHDAFI